MSEYLIGIDGSILLWIQENLRMDALTPAFTWITKLGNAGAVWILITIVLLCFSKTRKVGVICLISLILNAILCNLILKNLVGRVRPYEVLEGLKLLIPKPGDESFPSGHSACAFAVAMVVYWKLPKCYGIPAVILASLIAFSRLYLGAHYPSDVMGGILLGIFCAWISIRIWNYFLRRKNKSAAKQR